MFFFLIGLIIAAIVVEFVIKTASRLIRIAVGAAFFVLAVVMILFFLKLGWGLWLIG